MALSYNGEIMKYAIFAFALVLFLAMPLVSAFDYEITYYDNSPTGNNIDTDPVSFFSEEADSILLSQNIFFTFNVSSPPDSYTATYQSPFSTTFGITSGTLNSNQSCLNLGIATKSYTQDNVEGRNTITHDGSASSFISTGNTYSATTDDRFLIVDQDALDSESFMPNIYFRNDCLSLAFPIPDSDITDKLNSDNFMECVNVIPTRITRTYTSCTANVPKYYGYTIFNSTAGNVSFISFTPDNLGTTSHLLYPLDEPTTIIERCTNTIICIKNVNLEPNRLYVIGVAAVVDTGGTDTAPTINVTIDLGVADYECPDFGECIDGFKTRECIDKNGLQPNLIETIPCELIVLENVTLGFEDFVTLTDVKKCVPTWLLGCGYSVSDITVDRPINWTVVENPAFRQNFVAMSQDWATEGSRSVKMWYIPPTQDDHPFPTTPTESCNDLDNGLIPQIFTGVNDSTFLSFNVTFPAANMLIKYDTKRCDAPELKHSALKDIFDFSILCPERCYASNCSIEPRGRYVFNIVDTVTTESLLGSPYYDDAQLVTKTPTFDLSDLGIVVNRTYNIVFAVFPENLNDQTGDCVYFDNVQYQVTDRPITAIVGEACTSTCLGTTRLEATLLPNGNCLVQEVLFSPICLDPEQKSCVENLETCCLNDREVLQLNPKTSQYQTITCGEGTTCVDGACTSDEEIEEIDDSTQPAEDTEDFLGWFNWLFSPLFIYFIVTFLLAGIITRATTSGNKDGKGMFEVFGAVIIIMMLIGTLPGIAIIPIWVAIAIIVVVALLIAQIMGIFAGRG